MRELVIAKIKDLEDRIKELWHPYDPKVSYPDCSNLSDEELVERLTVRAIEFGAYR